MSSLVVLYERCEAKKNQTAPTENGKQDSQLVVTVPFARLPFHRCRVCVASKSIRIVRGTYIVAVEPNNCVCVGEVTGHCLEKIVSVLELIYIIPVMNKMPALDEEGDANSFLSTIAEEDDSSRSGSGSTTASTEARNKQVNNDTAVKPNESELITAEDRKEEKRRGKKERKKRLKEQYAEDHETAQQILVDLCSEMRELKSSLKEDQEKTTTTMIGNLESNQLIMKSLSEQMEAMQGNMRQLDHVIESKATPEQIEDLARIRAVQEMITAVTEDKEKTVKLYETHARRGYEEIERLRQDLENERKEVAALRTELEIVREERHRMKVSTPMGSAGGLDRVTDDSSSIGGSRKGPGGMYLNGSASRVDVKKMSDFDDMTLETKGSYDTTTYEMKSLKKRIIHMKKKLAVAQQEAKEATDLRAEVERLRVSLEIEKRSSVNKDDIINRLREEIEIVKRGKVGAKSVRRKSQSGQDQTISARSVTVTTESKKKWWQN